MKELKIYKNLQEQLDKVREPFAFLFTSDETISARRLHKALGNKLQFTKWIASKQTQYIMTIEEKNSPIDYVTEKGVKSKDYILSLDTAKMLSMQELSETGTAVRNYFISCDKALEYVLSAQMLEMKNRSKAQSKRRELELKAFKKGAIETAIANAYDDTYFQIDYLEQELKMTKNESEENKRKYLKARKWLDENKTQLKEKGFF